MIVFFHRTSVEVCFVLVFFPSESGGKKTVFLKVSRNGFRSSHLSFFILISAIKSKMQLACQNRQREEIVKLSDCQGSTLASTVSLW